MKLVIDIDEELYKNVVEHAKNGYIGSDVWIAVANGIPYEERPKGECICPTCRLYDGTEYCQYAGECTYGVTECRYYTNPPTVKTYTEEDMSGAYNEGYACGSRENKRPQGEWADHNTCPFCNHTYDWEYNFCPNCGADLRGDT